jgi:pre-mRNA-splicing factor SYF1
LERIRDVFEHALRGCPASLSSPIFVQYAIVEEQYGSIRNALKVLDRAVHHVEETQLVLLYDLLLAKTATHLGMASQRAVFEDAINRLPQVESTAMSLRFANLEMSLGEIERARSIYTHAASADPRTQPALWAAWQEFETRHGTESTFRDMLRVKRAISAKFATMASFVPATESKEMANFIAAVEDEQI